MGQIPVLLYATITFVWYGINPLMPYVTTRFVWYGTSGARGSRYGSDIRTCAVRHNLTCVVRNTFLVVDRSLTSTRES